MGDPDCGYAAAPNAIRKDHRFCGLEFGKYPLWTSKAFRGIVAQGGTLMSPPKVATLLELLRAHADVFSSSAYWMAFQMPEAYNQTLTEGSMDVLSRYLNRLRDECERLGLEMTRSLAEDTIIYAKGWNTESGCPLLHDSISHVCDILERELALQLFLKFGADRRRFYDEPFRESLTFT